LPEDDSRAGFWDLSLH